jgi:membrane protein implicated in regulation of membrane protease activity
MSFEQIEIWHYLIVAAFFFFIIEVFVPGFIAGSVGIGFLFAAVGSYFGFAEEWQIVLFAVGMAVSFFTIKPVILRLMNKTSEQKTNVDAMIGRQAIVTETIDFKKNSGRVKLDGDDWKAISAEHELIEVGQLVTVTEINSIVLTVKREVEES